MGIGYEDDIDKARNIMADILAKDERVLKDPAPKIAVVELADSSVNFVVRPWVKSEDYWDVHFDTTETIKKSFDAQGISIPFPQRDVHMYEHKA
jgi:small conductance mechanosensitive channel